MNILPATTDTASDPFLEGLWRNNPVFVQALGMCPTLAVSNSARNALAMGLATLAVLVLSNVVVASIRRIVPKQVRIATYILVIATLVTVVDYAIRAISLAVHEALGAFIALIVVNCVILGRAEAFASKHGVWLSFRDGLGMGLGFCWALFCLGATREIVGSGSLFGQPLFHAGYQGWVMMILPSGGFFALAAWVVVFGAVGRRATRHAAARQGAAR
jgi:electron transport complex protein RnfE